MIGRGVRLHEGKQDCLVIDFVDGFRRGADALMTVPTLLGLDPSVIADNDDAIMLAESEKEQASKANNPEDADLSNIQLHITEYDNPYELSDQHAGDPTLHEISRLAWAAIGTDKYVLPLRDGVIRVERIHDKGEFSDSSQWKVTSRSVEKIYDDKQQRWRRIHRRPRTLPVTGDTLPSVIRAVDTWVSKSLGYFEASLLDRNARFRGDPATEKQLRLLQRLGWKPRNPEEPHVITKGQAATIITRLTEGAGKLWKQEMKRKNQREMRLLLQQEKKERDRNVDVGPLPLTPKTYYELYMAIFDALRHLTIYLNEAHQSGRHHLADLYELVQYAGNIIPRLYLMITVGAAYMGQVDAPVREIMRDMMEMSRGVQHPTRGLFLRHYLSGMTRDFLPVGDSDGPEGNLSESIEFILTNFTEMNKLWVRMQHQGHSRDREKRELERRDLRILVGTNLVRLSQLEGVTLEIYQQEYLMEAIIQVFHDDFHLRTLPQFLSATAQLHPKVNVKQIIIALIDRLAAYAAREAESESPEELRKLEEKATRKAAEDQGTGEDSLANGNAAQRDAGEDATGEATTGTEAEDGEKPSDSSAPVRKIRGIPEDVQLFVVFWGQIVELVKVRPDLSIQDLTALLVSLCNLSVSCYPDRLNYVNQILGFAKGKVEEFSDSPDLHSPTTISNLLALLLVPITNYVSVLTLLSLTDYQSLLDVQPFSTRKAVAQAVVSSILKNETNISTADEVDGVLRLCDVLIRDQKDAPVGANVGAGNLNNRRFDRLDKFALEELAEEQGWLARIIHLLRSDQLDTQFSLLTTASKHFSEGGMRIKYTFPAIISSSISADECRFEEIAYEFFVQAFTIYEESISESRAQYDAIICIVGTLQTTTIFSLDSYDTLITKAALHGSKLLKKPDQCRAVIACSNLWWQSLSSENQESKEPVRHEKRVLECLQKALKIADSCMDATTNVELFVEILNRYVFYFEQNNEAVTVKYLNGLIDLITSNIPLMKNPDQHPPSASSSALFSIEGSVPDYVINHFNLTIEHIKQRQQDSESASRYSAIEIPSV
ncbi:hypothetical protein BZG36_05231 [Bifiguratus adelaidae]|uniref:Vacuolar protein sorting-associated protein 35 n=1 Tax=Bifiguratus adelaidae TaxID=1938954 RepID=A0A261XUV8_9FUNG|nr:hypothetical protein BZG36_05231 [Bifiguratus adelaidae]